MVQLQNSPTPLQARPARPQWPQPSLSAVPLSRGLRGAPGPVPPVPQRAQHQPPGLLSRARGVAGRGGEDIGDRARRAATGCSAVPEAGPAPRREPVYTNNFADVGGWMSRSPWLGRVPRGWRSRESRGAGGSPLGSL